MVTNRIGLFFYWLCSILAILALLVALVSGAALLFGFSQDPETISDALTLASFAAIIFYCLGWAARIALRKRR